MNSWEEGELILLMLKSSCVEITGSGRPGPWGMAWSIPHTPGCGWAGDRQVAVSGRYLQSKYPLPTSGNCFFTPCLFVPAECVHWFQTDSFL